jgi:galactokinase
MEKLNFINRLNQGEFDDVLKNLYGTKAFNEQKIRYKNAVDNFSKIYPNRDEIKIYSAPGRTEIGGNHTDHQNGCVLAAAVNLDVIAVVAFHNDGVIRLKSEGYKEFDIELLDLGVNPDEKGTSASIVRGIASKFVDMGVDIGGFDVYATSDVLSGSGLSSSAAFENLIGTIIDLHYNDGRAGAVEVAKISQYAENVYFGKGSGLMDQMVSSVGGFVFIDFENTESPKIESHNFNFEQAGYCICITDTKGSHADLTEDYVSVPVEMKSIAKYFGKSVLRDVDEEGFYSCIPELRNKCGDRAVMRAAHFFGENQRAIDEAQALENGDIDKFFSLVRSSASSSANLLQNLYSCKKINEQGIPLAIMMSKHFLGENAVVRVHGGGFAGTIQAFVPIEKAEDYSKEMNRIFGDESCYILRIRPVGGIEITNIKE